MHLSFAPHVLHTLPISFFLTKSEGLLNISYDRKLLLWGVVSTSPKPQHEGPHLVGHARLLFKYIRSCSPHLEVVLPSATWRRTILLWEGPTDPSLIFTFASKTVGVRRPHHTCSSKQWPPLTTSGHYRMIRNIDSFFNINIIEQLFAIGMWLLNVAFVLPFRLTSWFVFGLLCWFIIKWRQTNETIRQRQADENLWK